MERKALLISMLLTIFCVGSVLAQEQSKKVEEQCESFESESFKKNITFTFNNADGNKALKLFADNLGCDIVVDKDVKFSPLTIEFKDKRLSWALYDLLRMQNLGMAIKEKIDTKTNPKSKYLFISTKEKISTETSCLTNFTKTCYPEIEICSASRCTIFITLNYLPVCDPCVFGCGYYKVTPLPPKKIVKLVGKFLSQGALIETDERSNSLIITDTRERIDFIRKQMAEWDKPNRTIDKILKDFESKILTNNYQ
jgi:type II secretory pathway component GspD/PulD (secretin)